jgi:SAM-dependent methyltransferase
MSAARFPDSWRDVDGQPDAVQLGRALELRGRAPSQRRLRRRFLRFVPVRPGQRVLEVGAGTGVVLRDVAALVGRRGQVVGLEPSAGLRAQAHRLCRRAPGGPIAVRAGLGTRLPFRDAGFDVTLAVTVLLHVAEPARVVAEMARVTRPGGRVAVQDQDFGMVAAAHPDRQTTEHIMRGVAEAVYEEPHSGRRLPALLLDAGLTGVRLLTDVYQDTRLDPFSRSFLERRAANAVRFGLLDAPAAQAWLDGFTELAARGAFVLTMNYYGAVGVRPSPATTRAGRGRR